MPPGTSAPRRLVGVDLAADPRRTGVVVAEPGPPWRLTGPAAGDDATILALADGAVLALDAPLGWPDAFVAAVAAHHGFRGWPPGADREDLRHRATDRHVTGRALGVRPLSVSSDLIGVVAMRAAFLLDELGARRGRPLARDGSDGVVEVYPAAALRAWGLLAPRGERYKGGRAGDPGPRAVRRRILGALGGALAGRVELDGGLVEAAEASDHVLDAAVSALVGLESLAGRTEGPPPGLVARAAREGWIHVPRGPL